MEGFSDILALAPFQTGSDLAVPDGAMLSYCFLWNILNHETDFLSFD
jgi:hypothetical protein